MIGELKDEAQATHPSQSSQDRPDPTRNEIANGQATSIVSVSTRSEPERKRNSSKRKWHSLIDKVYAPTNLAQAWKQVASNKGAGGVDGMTVAAFSIESEGRLQRLSEDLRNKTYRPQPVRRVFIAKSGGGERPLGIPTVRDRIVQQALLQVLEPIFERTFSHRSHGFRPSRGTTTALDVVDRAVLYGYEWVVDADIQSFFDEVDHDKLMNALNEEIADGRVIGLIRRILAAGSMEPGASQASPSERGTPQGGPLSPLLANVYLHAFDLAMTNAGYGLVRYADDFVIFAKSQSEAVAALALSQSILEEQWGLRLHPEKTRIISVTDGFEFLGFHYFRDPIAGVLRKLVRRKSASRFRESIRALTPRLKAQRSLKLRHLTYKRLSKNQRLQQVIQGVNRYLRGWHWYFKDVWSPYDTPFRDLDGFVRRRLRSVIGGRHGRGVLNVRLPTKLLCSLGLISLDTLQQHYRSGQLAAPVWKGRPGGEPYAGKPHVRFGREGTRVTCP